MTGLSDETLLTLKDACEIYFGGKITPATLKAEHDRGNLALSKIGRSYFRRTEKTQANQWWRPAKTRFYP